MVQYTYSCRTRSMCRSTAVATFHTRARQALIIILGTRVLILVSRAVYYIVVVSFKSCVYAYLSIAEVYVA